VQLTTLAVMEERNVLTHMAVGLVNGTVVVIYGDLTHEKVPRQKAFKVEYAMRSLYRCRYSCRYRYRYQYANIRSSWDKLQPQQED
jgi:hypothetical protein